MQLPEKVRSVAVWIASLQQAPYVKKSAIETLTKAADALGAASPGGVYGIIDPDYGRIYTILRTLAWQEGYAIGLHGSFTRDLDLIAVPWTERPSEPEHLVRRILDATGLKRQSESPGVKPQGRLVWTLLLPEFGDPRFVDLSIYPKALGAPCSASHEDTGDK